MLSVRDISVQIGGYRILDRVNFECEKGRVTAIIGPNGAGKTTLFDAMTGFTEMQSGAVVCDGRTLPRGHPYLVARNGLSRTFQTPRLFDEMTVEDNLAVAAADGGLPRLTLSAFLRHEEAQRNAESRHKADLLLDFLRLGHVRCNLTSDLSGGQRKLVELGRALMTDPHYLMLDEPVAGVAPALVKDVGDRLRELAARGLGVLVIEHNMDFVMSVSDYVIVLVGGKVLTEGAADDVRSDQRVLEAYLGEGTA